MLKEIQEEKVIHSDKLKQLESALKESENKFYSLTQSAVDSIVIANDAGKVVSWNRSAEKMFGYKLEEMLDKPLDLIIPEKYVGLGNKKGVKRYLRTGIEKIIGNTVELEGIKRDGKIFPIELSLSSWSSGGQSFFCGIIRDITDRKLAEQIIKKSLEEKEVLLKEVYHRVKNNLQIVNSLLSIYSAKIEDPVSLKMYQECKDKIYAMAVIHDSLYQSNDFQNLDLEHYISTLSKHFQQSCINSNVQFDLQLVSISIPFTKAITCGIILSELFTNACKHAFPNTKEGTVTIKLEAKSKGVHILFADNGVGFPKDYKTSESNFGLSLVQSLTEQLQGKFQIVHSNGVNGTKHLLQFPISD